MKQLRWPVTREAAAYLRGRQEENLARALSNRNENWMAGILRSSTNVKWGRQKLWGYRIFDFWSSVLGAAVEVDGKEHDKAYDSYRDEYNFRRSALVVLRVRNKNEDDAKEAVELIGKIGTWADRRSSMGIKSSPKKGRRVDDDPDFSRLAEYLGRVLG